MRLLEQLSSRIHYVSSSAAFLALAAVWIALGSFAFEKLSDNRAAIVAILAGITTSAFAGAYAAGLAKAARRLARKRVFLSYSSDEKALAMRLADVLSKKRLCVWFDPEAISPGASILATLRSKIDSADVVVMLFSAASVKSKWQEWELKYAQEQSKHIIPVRLGDVTLPEALRDLKYIDLSENRADAVQVLVAALT